MNGGDTSEKERLEKGRQKILTPKKTIHVLSLGAGVQSSMLALMAARGLVEPMPLAAIFSDTQAEPGSVYRWLDWLEKQLPFPVYRVTKGNLEEDTIRIRLRRDGLGHWCPSGIPHYTINADGSQGHGPRQCTHDYKLIPIARKQRQLMREHKAKHVICWIGISFDEQHRMKLSTVKYRTHWYPLVERKIRRDDCLKWMLDNGYPKPPRSACVFCPYHSNAEWYRLKTEEPEEFARAVAFEKKYQAAKTSTVSAKGLHAVSPPETCAVGHD